jgi:DNA-binding MurR/RpiR family transcriptional regulator
MRGGLLLVGTPAEEPWHLAAHLDDESRLSGITELAPTLVRWNAPVNAPPHLRVGLERLEAARRGETLFVVTPETAPAPLLERVSGARRAGATILALNQGDRELDGLAHETLTVQPGVAPVSFSVAQHLVSATAGERIPQPRRGVRQRLARLLDVVSGPST